jgi:hypothetical protein
VEALTYQFPACEWRDETGLANIFAEDGRPVSAPGPPRCGPASEVACGLLHGGQLLTGPLINVSLKE